MRKFEVKYINSKGGYNKGIYEADNLEHLFEVLKEKGIDIYRIIRVLYL